MDEKKHPTQSQSKLENQKDAKEPQGGVVRPTAAKRVMSKRWLYPAIYLGAAALIIGLMYVKSQMSGSSPTSVTPETGSTQPTATTEAFTWPVADGTTPKVTMGFFPQQGTSAQQAAALVLWDNTYFPHQGLDIKSTNGNTFSVAAAVSGTVTNVTKAKADPLHGNTVEVESANGYVERYESLGTVSVNKGDSVKQGQVIGTSGTCEFEPNQGNHLYFEVLKNSSPIDPATLLPKQ